MRQRTGEPPLCVYQPPVVDGDLSILAIAYEKLKGRAGKSAGAFELAMALDADDVIIRSIVVPSGLTDAQLEQVAIVEAVANVPVPPEEVCLDFLRVAAPGPAREERVNLAFCRRERVDHLLAIAESVPVKMRVVDRDVQAIHDAACVCVVPDSSAGLPHYPFALLLTSLQPRLVICLDPLHFEVYPIRRADDPLALPGEGVRQQIANCWTRCRMAHDLSATALMAVWQIGESIEIGECRALPESDEGAMAIHPLPMRSLNVLIPEGEVAPPDEVLLVAWGMSMRGLA